MPRGSEPVCLVSPFKDGQLDEASFRRMVGRYAGQVDGFILAATTGEDAGYLAALRQGADGGVLGSAHLRPEAFQAVRSLVQAGRWDEAARAWADLASIPELLFAEPSPSPLKHVLWRMGVIDRPEVRLPMTPVSRALAGRLDTHVGLMAGG